jgi:hypothetical protein
MQLAKSRYDAMGLPPLHVSAHFNDQASLRKSDVEPMTQRVVDLAIRLTPPVGGRAEEEYTWFNRSHFPEQITVVMVHRPEALRRSFWSAPSAGYLPKLSILEVQKEIDKKDARILAYRKNCDCVWLVLCSHGEGLSSYVDLSDEALAGTYRTRFDRVLLYRWSTTVHELGGGGA